MKIIIVGAGIGGLSAGIALSQAGHKVLILESAPALAEIGAGVQMTPDAIKYFFQWGLKDDILAKAALPGSMFIRHWEDGGVLGRVPIRELENDYGAPYIVVHRAVLHDILHRHALKAGTEVRVNSRVANYEFDQGVVVLKSGERLQADLVVAADGINSFARKQLLGDADVGAQKTGWAAYRMMAEVEKIKANPSTANLVSQHNTNLWIGEGRSVMTYMIYESKMLNMVMSHRDNIDTSNWTSEQYLNEIQNLYHGWDARVTSLIDLALTKIQNWPVYQVTPLPQWTHKSGRFALMGDAAHAMAPYLSMGVSLAVEDAVALAECLSLIDSSLNDTSSNPNQRSMNEQIDLAFALQLFESVRKPRAEAVQKASLHAGNILHLPTGHEQQVRDRFMNEEENDREPMNDKATEETYGKENVEREREWAYGIADRRTRDWCYGYDAIKPVKDEWERTKSQR